MKTGLISLFVCIMGISAAYSQAIPPFAGGQTTMPDSIPKVSDKKVDLPCKAGSYVVEGGANFYYTKGNYYKPIDPLTGNTYLTDSKGNEYTPWGININPSAEFFLFDKFALGGTAQFNYEKDGADKSMMIGIGPIMSIYYNDSYPVIPYFSVYALYQHTTFYLASTSSMYWIDEGYTFGGKVGFVFMISRQAGVFIDGRYMWGSHQEQFPPATTRTKTTGWQAESFFGFKFFVF
jgi:hypothetical protein